MDIKARVTGFLLDKVMFEEGQPVKRAGAVPDRSRPYIAQLAQANAQIGLYQAQVDLNTKTYQQKLDTKKKNPDAITDLDLRTTEAQMKESQAALDDAKASLQIYELNKKYTTVTSP